jgi:hypothetical protein
MKRKPGTLPVEAVMDLAQLRKTRRLLRRALKEVDGMIKRMTSFKRQRQKANATERAILTDTYAKADAFVRSQEEEDQ